MLTSLLFIKMQLRIPPFLLPLLKCLGPDFFIEEAFVELLDSMCKFGSTFRRMHTLEYTVYARQPEFKEFVRSRVEGTGNLKVVEGKDLILTEIEVEEEF
jgi:hypothetical protein